MKKPIKKDRKDSGTKGKNDQPNRKQSGKKEQTGFETPMEQDAGHQDGSAGLSGTSAI